jgi:hypothetical protein
MPGVQTNPAALHGTYVGILGELIGVAVLAIFADMNEDVGKVAVTVMIGWFIIFLIVNAAVINKTFTSAGLIQPPPSSKKTQLV